MQIQTQIYTGQINKLVLHKELSNWLVVDLAQCLRLYIENTANTGTEQVGLENQLC